ncbi:cofactor-independent phosphoglycerate mutase [soil metagenome]
MKHAIIILDGAADLPLAELGARTPLSAAHTPNLDALAQRGMLLTARTTPPGCSAGSDVCTMDLLGYDPRVYHTGRAPLEAAAVDMPMGDRDWVFRVNLISTGGDAGAPTFLDHSAGAITDGEALGLFNGLLAHWRSACPEVARTLTLRHGVSYRASMVDAWGHGYAGVRTTPPHDVPGERISSRLPTPIGSGGEESVSSATHTEHATEAAVRLRTLIEASREFLARHPVNARRRAAGLRTADLAWPWGQGTKPQMPQFAERYGVRGAMITAVDLLAGIARLIGWERLDVPGVTSYHDTDYAAQGTHAAAALDRFDLIVCHVEAPDEASHQGDWRTKVAAIEAIDEKVVAPIVRKLESFGPGTWRIMALPDHFTLVSTKKHDATPVPVLMAGAGIAPSGASQYDEAAAMAAGVHLEEGHDLMAKFLTA